MTTPTITVENSAPSQIIPAKSVKLSTEIIKPHGIKSVVDFGCGRLRNIPILTKEYKNITVVDTKKQCEKIIVNPLFNRNLKLLTDIEFYNLKVQFDAVYLILVLHIIPDIKTRMAILKSINDRLNKGGFLIIDVPTGEKYYRNKCNSNNRYLDGWLMKNGNTNTFYKQYSTSELDNFIANCTKLDIFTKISIDKHIVRIFKKNSA
jgi:SAM-dependent methyltransferase